METSKKIESYYGKEHHFKAGINILRDLALSTNAEEYFKWQAPVYGIDGKNVFWIARFKNHFGLGFFHGMFLKDPLDVLVNVQKGKTMAMRHWHFTSIEQIDRKGVVAYIMESLENQKKGLVLAPAPSQDKKSRITIPKALQDALNANSKAKSAFKNLSPYKQAEYVEYIREAKQDRTKLSRLEKMLPMILEGKGLNDKYR